jgi:hypothetical protein
MSIVILKGEEAIHYAQIHGLTLNEYASEDHGPRTGLTVEEARRVQDDHRGHVWLEVEIAIHTGEPRPHH